MRRTLISIVLMLSWPTKSIEYLYPVCSISRDARRYVYLLHQKEGGLNLLSWNPASKELNKAISSRFIPTDVQILPDDSGFSFVDQGVIWVKLFSKRSPRVLDIPAPLCDIDLIHWKTARSCYFSARQRNTYALFELDLHGNLDCLVSSDYFDCVYPQYHDASLFFLARDKHTHDFQLYKTSYPEIHHESVTFNWKGNYDERVNHIIHDFKHPLEPHRGASDCTLLYAFDSPVSFLRMVSCTEGFVVMHEPFISSSKEVTEYNYYHLQQEDGQWTCQLLFSFFIPLHYVKPSSSIQYKGQWIYESIQPLLPYHVDQTNQIYFVSLFEQSLGIFRYDVTTGEVDLVTPSSKKEYFSPLYVGGQLLWGGTIDTTLQTTSSQESAPPYMWLNNNGRVCLSMPNLEDLQ